MGSLELCRILDRRQRQHQHLDDFLVDDCGWAFVVASLALRLDRLWDFCRFHHHLWSCWCCLPPQFSGFEQSVLWYLGKYMAGVQPCCYG